MEEQKELQKRVAEPEAKDSPAPDEGSESKQKRQQLERTAERKCSHAEGRLEHRFCPTCGESMPALPATAIEQLVEKVLARHSVADKEPEFGSPEWVEKFTSALNGKRIRSGKPALTTEEVEWLLEQTPKPKPEEFDLSAVVDRILNKK